MNQMKCPVIDYIAEEVWRQGHDITDLDGIQRIGWMIAAWSAAQLIKDRPLIPLDAIAFGKLIEPGKNYDGIRKVDVWVGDRKCPDARLVPELLENLFKTGDTLSPMEFYMQFELIHPFVDGNGRTGKIILNHRNRTLWKPVFPPNDMFGRWIRNP